MSYSNSPLLPKARRQAVNLVLKEGFSVTVAARRSGIARVTLYRWLRRAKGLHGVAGIPTKSSKPKSCPWQISAEIVSRVIELRRQHRRCGKVIQALLTREGTVISVASVNRAQLLFSSHSHQLLAELDKQQIILVEKTSRG